MNNTCLTNIVSPQVDSQNDYDTPSLPKIETNNANHFSSPCNLPLLDCSFSLSFERTHIFDDREPIPFSVDTPISYNDTSNGNHYENLTGFPLHPRYPIPFSVETPNHDDSRMNENTYPQVPTNPSDANNDLDLLKDLRKT